MVNPLKKVFKTSYNNTHPVAFVYSQRQEIRSMTAIRTQQCAMTSPGRSRVPDPGLSHKLYRFVIGLNTYLIHS